MGGISQNAPRPKRRRPVFRTAAQPANYIILGNQFRNSRYLFAYFRIRKFLGIKQLFTFFFIIGTAGIGIRHYKSLFWTGLIYHVVGIKAKAERQSRIAG